MCDCTNRAVRFECVFRFVSRVSDWGRVLRRLLRLRRRLLGTSSFLCRRFNNSSPANADENEVIRPRRRKGGARFRLSSHSESALLFSFYLFSPLLFFISITTTTTTTTTAAAAAAAAAAVVVVVVVVVDAVVVVVVAVVGAEERGAVDDIPPPSGPAVSVHQTAVGGK